MDPRGKLLSFGSPVSLPAAPLKRICNDAFKLVIVIGSYQLPLERLSKVILIAMRDQ